MLRQLSNIHLQDRAEQSAATFLRDKSTSVTAEQSCSRNNLQLSVLPSLPLLDSERACPTARNAPTAQHCSSCSTPTPVTCSVHCADGRTSSAEQEMFRSPTQISRQSLKQNSVTQNSSLLPTSTLVALAARPSLHIQLSHWSTEQNVRPLAFTGSRHFVSDAIL